MQYLDINYKLGNGMFGGSGYGTLEEILGHMDYLGIDRGVVWSAEARDWSGINGNRELLAALSPYRERLFPAFVMSPRDYYESGTMEYYKDLFAKGEVRCIRICVKGSHAAIHEMEFVLGDLSQYHPLVQFDTQELALTDYPELELLAKKLPDIRIVLSQKIWCEMDLVFNLMKRCRNVYLDTSWLHVRGTMELVIQHFGVERLLFATGLRNQYGASIGCLTHLQIPQDQKEAIAHGNAEKLLGLKPLEKPLFTPPPLLDSKPLWRQFAAGLPLEGIDTIDAHVHQGGPAGLGYLGPDSDISQSLPNMVSVMDSCGIRQSVVIGSRALQGACLQGNRELHEQAAPLRERLFGNWAFNPHHCSEVTEAYLDQEFADGFYVGFKILPAYWGLGLDHPGFTVMWQYAENHHLPVLMHTWNDVNLLNDVVPKYPNVKFIVGHSGGGCYGREDCIKLARQYSNVYFDTCGTFCCDVPLMDIIPEFGVQRFIFGTDAAYHSLSFELSSVLSMPLPDDLLAPIFGANYRQLMEERR